MSGSGTGMPASAMKQPSPNPLTASGDGTGLPASGLTTATAYISVVEAAAWLAVHVRITRLAAWNALNDADKAVLLQQATDHIDSLTLRGRKYYRDGSQINQFPREYRDGYNMNERTGEVEIPQAVKDACCWEAIAILGHEDDEDAREREKLQSQGVQSISEGGQFSETYVRGAREINAGLKSKEAYRLLSKHIARSFPIV